MYWIYLGIFVFIILTPKIIQDGAFFLREDDIESLLIFCFGVFGFLLYLVKEKALITVLKEKLNLQKQTHIITRDLSDSYSYIGEMNRKFDIVKELIFRLPKETVNTFGKKEPALYHSVMEAIHLLTKVKPISLRFVNVKTKEIEKIVEEGTLTAFRFFEAGKLLQSKKMFWEEKGYAIVRSPEQACQTVVFLIFPKATNRVEDIEIFKILASEALFLYCVECGMDPEQMRLKNSTT